MSGEQLLIGRDNENIFWDVENILELHSGGDRTTLNILRPLNLTVSKGEFTVFESCLDEAVI